MSTTLLIIIGAGVVLFFVLRNKRGPAGHDLVPVDEDTQSSVDHHGAHGNTENPKMRSSKEGGRKRSGCC